ncbi:MAG: hypothetical protein ACE5HO_16425, partial [bacterium]
VKALVVYAQDSNDYYPVPSQAMRDSIYARLSRFYATMSYGAHRITFKECLNAGRYFVADYSVPYYKKHYNPKKHVRGFGMFNEEILHKVKAQKGEACFSDVDLIIMAGTDGGRDWYTKGYNATGFGMLGTEFSAAGKTFGRGQRQGGFTVEIGSDIGTPDSTDDRFLPLSEIYWNFSHEYGHWLGLGHHSCKLGIYSLMCKELRGNDRMPEFGPPPLDIFHIFQLGWLSESDSSRVRTIAARPGSLTVTLEQIRSPEGLVAARIDLPGRNEKLFVCYHRQSANTFDGVYPGEGLLIWSKNKWRIELEYPQTPGQKGGAGTSHRDRSDRVATAFFRGDHKFSHAFSTPPGSRGSLGKDKRPLIKQMTVDAIHEMEDRVTFRVFFR